MEKEENKKTYLWDGEHVGLQTCCVRMCWHADADGGGCWWWMCMSVKKKRNLLDGWWTWIGGDADGDKHRCG